jgi:hypothetical protein
MLVLSADSASVTHVPREASWALTAVGASSMEGSCPKHAAANEWVLLAAGQLAGQESQEGSYFLCSWFVRGHVPMDCWSLLGLITSLWGWGAP